MEFLYSLSIAISLVLFILLRALVRRLRSHSISHLPGPPPGPWLVGNLPEIVRPEHLASAEFAWTNSYGTVLKIKGAFGIDVLFSADPKVIQYVLNTSAYNYHTPQHTLALNKISFGEGILHAQGSDHTRHRKVMSPGFSFSILRGYLPLFFGKSQKTVAKLEEKISLNGGEPIVVDIPSWLTRTTLDVMGQAALDYEFGAIDETNNEFAAVYKNLFADSFYMRSNASIAFEALWGYLPLAVSSMLINLIPTKQVKRLRKYTTVADRVAKRLMDRAQSESASKQGERGVMSLLIRANLSEDPKSRLSDYEVISQLKTLMIAGQETTGSTLTFALYELSRHPDIQTRVREEIMTARSQALQRGNSELTVSDLDAMKLLLAVIKETLRCHPIATTLPREAVCEDVIPLSTPLTTTTGEVITSIPISKGQYLFLSVAAYNRLKSVWGQDADVWRPERFLEGMEANQKIGLGVISNLGSFGSGVRSCIGWRFAILEMQTILIEFLEHFEFSPAPGNPEIIRSATGLMTPMVKEEPGRVQLPLTLTSVI